MQDHAFFSVFDGHNGVEAAAYASTHIIDCLFEAINTFEDHEHTNADVLLKAFELVDERISFRCIKQVRFRVFLSIIQLLFFFHNHK